MLKQQRSKTNLCDLTCPRGYHYFSLKTVAKERGYAKELAHCVYAEGPRHTGTDWSRNYVSYPESGEVRRLTPGESERLQGFPTGWTDIYDNTDDSKRYHACGNAVTVPVIAWIANRMVKVLNACDSTGKGE